MLAAYAWEVAPSWLIAHDTDPTSPAQISRFHSALARRLSGEPIAYITGYREFYGREFHVTPNVLIPRPETELLVELALARMPIGQALHVLDLGTGSGCVAISLALERPDTHVTSVDSSREALAVAELNKQRWNVPISLLESDWFSALTNRQFDVIVGNPPYIAETDPHLNAGDVRYEPGAALRSGQDGMDALRHIIGTARSFLKAGGNLLLEHGYNQHESVQEAFRSAGFIGLQTAHDMAGHYRVALGTHPSE